MANFRVHRTLPAWRRIALSTWRRGDDPTIYGWIDVEAGPMQSYVQRLREATGTRVTITHVIGKAAAMAFAAHPDCNGIVSLGRLKLRDSVDVFFQVATDGGKGLSGAKVTGADKLSVEEIAHALERGAQRIRTKGDTALQKSQNMLRSVPGVLMGAALRAGEILMFDGGFDLTKFGIPYDPFGTVMITNVGVFGIEHGLAPLMPVSRTPGLLTIGAVRDRVVAIDGKPQVRPMLTIGATFDHRVIDGYHVGQLAKALVPILENPEVHLGSPDARVRANDSVAR